ncbi:hypothetical protein ACQEVB_27235 [Pseudonocardia sp. CA-107938]|uniref:hypothetical protein n=1 Tax=Pseudonocardia sp. CA-107938 TaxID=3240021 RepID=UPI003D8B52F3
MTVAHVVVDAANVVGSRPDGWWRDREGAARRLAEQLAAALAEPAALAAAVGVPAPIRVHVVLEGRAARATDLPEHADLVVVRAPADGDSTIAAVAAELPGDVVVVTADRELRRIVAAGGATVVGPGALRAVLR